MMRPSDSERDIARAVLQTICAAVGIILFMAFLYWLLIIGCVGAWGERACLQ